MTLLWPMAPLPIWEKRCLEYQYTNLGRWTYFGQCLPGTRLEMTCIQIHKTWQMNLLWPMDPHPSWVPEKRCLEYHYTKFGRQTYFGQWTPPVPEQRSLEYHNTKLGRWISFGQWPSQVPEQWWLTYHYTKVGQWTYFGQCLPGTRSEMTCIQIYKTWQMNLLWPMDPYPSWVPEKRCLEYHYTKLGRQTYFGWWTTQVPEQWWLAYHYTKLGRWPYFGQWPLSQYQSRDALNTTIQNFLDKPTLADGPPRYQSSDDLHTTTYNLADKPTLANGSHPPWVPEKRSLGYHYMKFPDKPTLANGTPKYKSKEDLHTTTQNLADEPTLANGPPQNRAEMPCIPVHQTWQINLCWLIDPPLNQE